MVEENFKVNFHDSIKWLMDRLEVNFFDHSNISTAFLDDLIENNLHIVIANKRTALEKNMDGYKDNRDTIMFTIDKRSPKVF